MIHNTLANSVYGLYVSTSNAGALYFDRGIVSGSGTAGIYMTPGSGIDPSVSYTLFFDNAVDGDTGEYPFFGDPLFRNPVGYDYHLKRGSAAIDRIHDGGLAEDIDDDDRPFGSGATPYDLGADEFIWSDFFFMPFILSL